MRQLFKILLCVLFGAASSVAPASAYAADKGQLVKAAFLYNFTKFVTWPGELSIASRSSINICVIGNNTLGDATAVFKEGSTATLTINAKILSSSPTTPGECHIAFLTTSQPRALAKQLQAASILTVSDAESFAENGGMIGFVEENNKIRLVVNKLAVEQAGLKIDAQLLEIARKVIQ